MKLLIFPFSKRRKYYEATAADEQKWIQIKMKIKKTLAMTGRRTERLQRWEQKVDSRAFDGEEKKTEASVERNEGAEEVQSWQVARPDLSSAPLQSETQLLTLGKVEANFSEIFQQRPADQWFDFQREAKKLPESFSCLPQ